MADEWVDIDSDWEDITPIKKTTLQNVMSLARGSVTPLLSEESARKSPAWMMAGRTLPTTTMTAGPFISSLVPPIMREQMAARQMSEQTSPLQILATLGILGGGAKQRGMLPQIMNKDYTLKNATMGSEALGNIRTTLGKAKQQAIANISNVPVNTNEIPLNNLPQTVMNAIDDPLYGIERIKNGTIRNTISNFDKVKEALGDFMTSKTWDEATKKSQQIIKQTYGKINEAMKNAARSAGNPIDDVLDNYHNFMKDYSQVIRTVEDVSGNIVERPLRSAFKPLAERGKIKAWGRLGEQSPEIAQMIKNMRKYTGRRTTQATFAGLGGLGLLAYIAHRYLANRVLPK